MRVEALPSRGDEVKATDWMPIESCPIDCSVLVWDVDRAAVAYTWGGGWFRSDGDDYVGRPKFWMPIVPPESNGAEVVK